MQPVGENVRKNGKGSEWRSKHFYRLSYGGIVSIWWLFAMGYLAHLPRRFRG